MAPAKLMPKEQLKTRLHSFITAYNTHDIDRILTFLTDDVVWEDPSIPDPVIGHEAVRHLLKDLFTAFPDLHIDLGSLELYETLDLTKAASAWRLSGTMKGPMEIAGYGATGKHAEIKGVCLYEFKGDKIRHHTIIYDQMRMAQQLGLLPREQGLPMKAAKRVQRGLARLLS